MIGNCGAIIVAPPHRSNGVEIMRNLHGSIDAASGDYYIERIEHGIYKTKSTQPTTRVNLNFY